MSDDGGQSELESLREQIRRLERVNAAMMDRIERSIDTAGTAYSMFEANILMQQIVRERTHEVEMAAERLEIAAQCAGIGIWEIDVQANEMHGDATMHRLHGLDAVTNVTDLDEWRRFLVEDDRELVDIQIERALRGEADFDMRLRIRRADGGIRHLRAFGRGIGRANGRAAKLIGATYDITEQVEQQDELRRSGETLEHASEIAKIGGWELDLAGKEPALEWSEGVRRIHEVPADYQPTLDAAIEFYAPEARATIARAVDEAIETGRPFDLVLPFETTDGRRLWVRAMGEAEFDSGRCVRVSGAFQDVTEQQRTRLELEAAIRRVEAANASKDEFLANMSHEIRTPMTAIVGYANLLESEPEFIHDPAQRGSAVQAIRMNANHLLRIINDILDLSKNEAGRMTVEHIETSPARILGEVVSGLRGVAEGKGLPIRISCDTPIPATISTDPTRLRQILHNLLGNAVKFTETGEVCVTASYDPANQLLQFAIADTGIGMTPEQLDIVIACDAFTQADSSMTRRFGGTGLGLRISSLLAQKLRGWIDVDSEFGKGSVFTLTLAVGGIAEASLIPADRAFDEMDQPAPNEPLQTAGSDARDLSGMRILLAEDGPDNQRLIAFVLNKAGAEVVVAENGVRAVEACESRSAADRFDLILMDMQMPELDGYSATQRLKASGCRSPIVALTAHAMKGDRDRCLDAGCDDYLSKPIDRQKLLETCLRWGGEAKAREVA